MSKKLLKPDPNLPKLKNIKTNWDLDKLYYRSLDDPQIEKDIHKAEKAYARFADKWQKTNFTKDTNLLKQSLTELEKVAAMPEVSKASRYFNFKLALNSNDHKAQQKQALLTKRLRKTTDKVIFYSLTLGKIPKQKQKTILADKNLSHFHYYLERIFLGAKYNLSEKEEKIINLKSPQSYAMWVDAVEKILSNREVSWKGKLLPVPEALETIDLLKTKDKIALWELIISEMKEIGEIAEHEFNAIITDVRTEDELRGYKKPYSATVLSYEDSEKSVENLVSTVSNEGFALSKKFYRLKAKYHRLKQIHYTQKYESIGPETKIPFKDAVEICRSVFYDLKADYGKLFDHMLENGQIDVYPKKGKRGGAFMSYQTNQPIHVFLNHTDNFKSLETLAHEMGHAIHASRSSKQTAFYDGHSITTAETASTLFENLLFEAFYEQVDKKKKKYLLHDRITRDIATIQRQIAFFNCELEIHQTITEQGAMTNKELAGVMYKHLKSYLGPAVSLRPEDGYSYVYVSHLRYGFYVYTYSFGILMSTIMAKKYTADKNFIKEIDKFLSAGESDNVRNLFKAIGIDTENKNTYKNALKNHEANIEEFEKMVNGK